jgi:hypothetical protein
MSRWLAECPRSPGRGATLQRKWDSADQHFASFMYLIGSTLSGVEGEELGVEGGPQPVVLAARIEASKELCTRAVPTFTCTVG